MRQDPIRLSFVSAQDEREIFGIENRPTKIWIDARL